MKKTKELAYWVGVAQSDGHYKVYNEKRKGKLIERHILQLGVSLKSFPMLKKFEEISQKIFGTSGNYCIDKRDMHRFEIKIKRFLNSIEQFNIDFSDPPKPPNWCLDFPEFFGAYLAGVVDGDGDIRILRPKYPCCAIRITSGHEQKELRNSIISMLRCGCSHTKRTRKSKIDNREIVGTYHRLEFYVSPKNFNFIKKYFLPEITIPHKRNKVGDYIIYRKNGRKGAITGS